MTEIIIRDERQRALVVRLLNGLDLAKPWRFSLVRYERQRSTEQSALFHKWMSVISQEVGMSAPEVKEWCRAKFLLPTVVTIGGEAREYRRSTTSLTVAEMSEFMDQISAFFASEFGIMLPTPQDQADYR